MKCSLVVMSALFAAMAVPCALAQSSPPDLMTPGLWEITIQMEAPDAGPPSTTEICISKDIAAKTRPAKSKAKDDCQVVDEASPSNVVAYKVTCTKAKRASSVAFTYYGDRYEGTVTTNMDGIEVRTRHMAKRIGACEAVPDGPTGKEN